MKTPEIELLWDELDRLTAAMANMSEDVKDLQEVIKKDHDEEYEGCACKVCLITE